MRESLNDVLQAMGEKATKAAKEALSKGADIVVDEAKNRCPVDTGNLRESIHKEIVSGGKLVRVVADADNGGFKYARVVEFSPRINKPFMYPAIEATREEVKNGIVEAVRESLKRR